MSGHRKSWGRGGVGLGMSIATASMSAAIRSGYDAMRGELKLWETELIEWRCARPMAEVQRLRGSSDGWDCADVTLFVGQASFEGVPAPMRDKLTKVPTRLRLKTDEVDMVIEAERIATKSTPEFNGFLASLSGNDADERIAQGIAVGGRRVVPVGN